VAQFEIFTINEKVPLKLGSAFNVVGKQRQPDFRANTSRKTSFRSAMPRMRKP
jgi:hypothetical protein